MRRWLVVGGILVAAVGIPVVAVAATSGGTSPINCQSTQWRTTPVSTSSSGFSTISGLGINLSSIYPMTITVSGVVGGGQPVSFRVLDDWVAGNKVSPPGVIPFATPASGSSAFSFTWTDPGGSAALRGHSLNVQWRRTSSSGTASLSAADVAVTYKTDTCTGSG
jgi:hypothetical protein